MATKTIHDFTAVTSLAGTDEILAWIVGSNTTRKITWANALTNATLVTPTIASFANAQHNHQNAAGGGTLDHGAALTGLSDDDHAQYLLATGARAGATSQAQTFTNGITVPSGGKVVIGTTSPITTAQLHVVQPATGAIVVTNLETDATTKVGRLAVPHYTNSEESLLVVGGAVTSTAGNIDFGGGSGVLNTATQITFYTAANNTTLTGTTRMRINSSGYISVGTHTATAFLHLTAAVAAAASACINSGSRPTTPITGDIWDDGALVSYHINATTNAVVNSLKLERESSGTPAAGFGLGIVAQLESSTTGTQDAGRLTWAWDVATHASRAAVGKLTAYYTSTEREVITWTATSAGATVLLTAVATTFASDNALSYPTQLTIRGTTDSNKKLTVGYNTTSNYGAIQAIHEGTAFSPLSLQPTGGNVGIGTVSPQSLLHGHDGTGGFMFVNRAAVDGTLVTVIPNGTGDVTENLSYFGYVKHSGGYTGTVAEGDLSPANYTIVSNAGNELTFGVASDGSFTLQRTAGTGTWNVCLWVIWR